MKNKPWTTTLPETNLSHPRVVGKIEFPTSTAGICFLVPWRVYVYIHPGGCVYIYIPLKINMEPQNGGLVQMIFLFNWVIFRFQPFILRGVVIFSCMFVGQGYIFVPLIDLLLKARN